MKEGTSVLLSLMQLNIGGAETHVVELAKELKRRGCKVTVTSKGGVYVTELEEAGITHYTVPLQNKNPLNLYKAYMQLKKIIRDEKIDVVHSHARIPSFVLGKLHKRMRFPFVTTAHWVFNTKYGLKYLTDWGQKTIAVSEDIKQYLMDNYHLPERDIKVTINGIDTERFSKSAPCEEVKREFGICDGDTVIVYVSRLDEDRSLAARQLIECAPELDQKIENLKIVVVGGGNDFEHIQELAKQTNHALNRTAVVLAGPRTDIHKFTAMADLFVGVSRAALEAMAAEKPAVIAGNEGYIGLFDKSKLATGIDTNFCCRGCRQSTPELILADTLRFFRMNRDERDKLGAYGREMVMRFYSVERMTDDTVCVYDWVLN